MSKGNGNRRRKSVNELDTDIDKLSKEMSEVEEEIVSGKADHKTVHKDIYEIRKKYLELEILINEHILSGEVRERDIKSTLRKLDVLKLNVGFLDDYTDKIMQSKQKQSLDSLTLTTLIFLPLSLITGYFGMNFKAMGSPSDPRGIFSWKHGQNFVMFMFMISIIGIILLVRAGIIYG